MELFRGTLHLFFPVRSHTVFSGVADGFGLPHKSNAVAAVGLVTAQLGTVNLTLALILMIPFLYGDPTLRMTWFMMGVKLVVKMLNMMNTRYMLTHNLWDRVPAYLKEEYGDSEAAQKLPPGKLVHYVEVGLLVVGIVGAVVEMRKNQGERVKGE